MATTMVAVASGKGGVGKTTVALNLARSLLNRGLGVGVLDLDLYGPDIPALLGVTRGTPLQHWTLSRAPGLGQPRIEPLERDGLLVMSAALLLGEGQQFAMSAGLIGPVVHQMLTQVDWSACDLVLVDMPPGVADLQQWVLARGSLAGVILVVTPQRLAHLDCGRMLEFVRGAGVAVLGGIENMSPTPCPHCGEPVTIYEPIDEKLSIWSRGVDRLGSVPFDVALQSPAGAAPPRHGHLFQDIGSRLLRRLGDGHS